MLLPGQNTIYSYDITARALKQKSKSLMSFITKLHVFGPTRCWIYSIERQKRELPHAHILIWLVEKLRRGKRGSVISAELPDPSTDQRLILLTQT